MEKASSVAETKTQKSRVSGSFPKPSSRNELPGEGVATTQSAESGVFSDLTQPVAGEQLLERLQSALGVASKGQSDLTAMQQALGQSTAALTASREAHRALAEELRVLYRGLNDLLAEKAGLERYAALLTQERDEALQAAEQTRAAAQKDRQFLLDEQDRFIRLLLEEHEEQLQRHSAAAGHADSASAQAGVRSAMAQAIVQEPESRASNGILPPAADPETSLGSESLGGDWNPREWAVSERVIKDEPPAKRFSLRRRKADSYPEEIAIHEEQESDLYDTTPNRSAAVARMRLAKVTTGSEPPLAGPGPAVVELAALAEEIHRNSDRPPPVDNSGTRPGASAEDTASLWGDPLVSPRADGSGTKRKD